MGKRKIKLLMLGLMDRIEQINAILVEKNKYKNKKRISIYNSVNLTKEQVNDTESLYTENYGKKIPLIWHRSYTAYTGNFDKNYVPELLYIPKFERYMNYNSNLANVLEDKNLLYVFAQNAHVKMPKRFLACQEGIFTDINNKTVSLADAILSVSNIGECFAKPSIGTDSGRGCEVYCFMDGKDRKTGKTCEEIIKKLGKNFVMQERLICHESIKQLYDGSVNTFRIMTYRWHNEIIAAPVIMRIGKGGAYLDNAHAGGMFIALSEDGSLHEKAFTELEDSYVEHPDSKIKFKNYKISLLPKVVETVKNMHYSLPTIGVINWDMTLDEEGNPVLIGANVNGGSIWLFQMAHGCGVFGDKTPEILRWIGKMDKLNYEDRQMHHFGD